MNRLAIQFLDAEFHRVMFGAMPVPVFVVDADVSILEYNSAAAQLLGSEKHTMIRRRGREALRCLRVLEVPEGRGHSPRVLGLRGAQIRAGRWSRQASNASTGENGTGNWAQVGQGKFTSKLPAVHASTAPVRSAYSRRIERLRKRMNFIEPGFGPWFLF